jgi:hypothetical protein
MRTKNRNSLDLIPKVLKFSGRNCLVMGFTFISPTSLDFEIPSFVSSSILKRQRKKILFQFQLVFLSSENSGKLSVYYQFCPQHELPD